MRNTENKIKKMLVSEIIKILGSRVNPILNFNDEHECVKAKMVNSIK